MCELGSLDQRSVCREIGSRNEVVPLRVEV
jgi:hypothetical protein